MIEIFGTEVIVFSIDGLLKKKKLLIVGLRREIKDLKLELQSMRSFLKDAEKCKDPDEGVYVWVAQVRDATYKLEDILDDFLYHMSSIKGGGDGLKGVFHRFIHLPKEIVLKLSTATKLHNVKSELKEIGKRSKRYDLCRKEVRGSSSHQTPTWAHSIGESSFFIEDNEIVGNERERDMLLNWLIGVGEEEKQRTVISVVGMGGSGKTTLVVKAYSNHDVKRHFDCYAWIPISQSYVIEDLFRNLVKEFFDGKEELLPRGLSTMSYKQLVDTLVKFLQERRYIVVLDDVWNTNIWKQISVALPEGRYGSRVIITTRNNDIAYYPYGGENHVLHSQLLSKEDSWTLFCNKAFSNEINKRCPPELKELAESLIGKCEGLPLAIVAMGGLMASKDKSQLKWREVSECLNWHLSNNPMLDEVKNLLLFSFNELPSFLKNCFLYCCRFPKDHWIGAGRLIRLWLAEGFLVEIRGKTLEEVGKCYLKELISRSLLQVKKNNTFLRPKLCKLHDLMWEIALSVSEQEKFCSIYDPQGNEKGEEGRPRRLSLLHTADGIPQLGPNVTEVRSFAAFNFDKSSNFPMDSFLPNFRLLRVLELRDAPIDRIPAALGKLFNLRYLNLKRTGIKELPESLGRLRSLLTLDIRRTEVEQLPDGILRMHHLRHLLTYRHNDKDPFKFITGTRVPATVWKLKKLQVLNCIEANGEIVKKIGEMTQLKRIELTNVRAANEKDLCCSLGKLKLLRHLLVMVSNESETLQMDALSTPPPNLRKLDLIGKLNNVPCWLSSLCNIIHLHLHWSQLRVDPIPFIDALPSLKRLILVNAYDHGKRQLCFNQGFPKLTGLCLDIFPELVEIVIAKGVMPNLVRLNLCACAKLAKVPHGIEHLTNLKRLDLKDVSEKLLESIRGEESVDRPRVRHIPEINHSQGTAESVESLS